MTGSKSVLPDANFWLALLLDKHRAHGEARRWLTAHPKAVLIFCRVTQMAFLRHLTTEAIMGPNVLSQGAAWQKYEELLARDDITFLGEPNGLEIRWRQFSQSNQPANKLWTDAYLAAFGLAHGLQLVTFDRGFAQYAGTEIEILEVNA